MNKRRLASIFVLGVLLAMVVSACGVALGPVQFTAEGPTILHPGLSGLPVPGLIGQAQPAVMESRHLVQRITSNNRALTLDAFGVGSCHFQP